MIENVSLSTIPTIPDIYPEDDLALIIGNALESHGVENGDILCICLLYTSPSPRDSIASRMPSSA